MYKGEFFSRVGATALLLSGTASLRNKLVIKSKQIEPRSKYDFLKRPSYASLLNYVPFVPTCLTCLCTLRAFVPSCLKLLLRAYVPYITTWLRALNYYVPLFLRAYMPMCLYIFFKCACLCAINYFVPTCAHFSRAYVEISHKIY